MERLLCTPISLLTVMGYTSGYGHKSSTVLLTTYGVTNRRVCVISLCVYVLMREAIMLIVEGLPVCSNGRESMQSHIIVKWKRDAKGTSDGK